MQQSRRRQSMSAKDKKEKDELNRSRRSSRARLMEDDLPEKYGDLAKRVYKMAEKEGWPKSKVIELLKNPA